MLLQGFLRHCAIAPGSLALTEAGRDLSYGDLLAAAGAVAGTLRSRGAEPGQRVAVCLDRGIDAVIAVFGSVLAGCCYVPLDIRSPPTRQRRLLEDAAVVTVIGAGDAPEWLEGACWLDLNAVGVPDSTGFEWRPVEASEPAAILYTSGSSGTPKGVVLSHGAVQAFAAWASDLLALRSADRIASSAPFFFDLSTFDLYAVLGSGASLHFLPSGLTLAPARLSAWLYAQAISGWYTVPSLLSFLAYKGNLPDTPLEALRFLVFAGEVFPAPSLIALAEALPDTRLYNFYGPTETNVCCHFEVERKRLRPDQAIPIGFPAAGDELRLVEGELWVRGPTLASGYLAGGRVQALCDGEGWYATGDRVSLGPDGAYRFHGRMGRMLKCSGYRVEPAEIEQAAMRVTGVRACAAVGIDDPAAGQRPVLALCLESPAVLVEVRTMLRHELPAYMQPVRWLQLDALPRLPTGKLDYARLKTLAAGS